MSLLFIDGFDAYGTNGQDVTQAMSDAGYSLSGSFGSSPIPTITNDTRTGVGYALNVGKWKFGGAFQRAFPIASTIVMGVAVNVKQAGFVHLFSLGYNNLLGGGADQLVISSNGTNGLTAQAGGNPYFSAPNVLFQNVWQYVEIKYTPGATTGFLEIKIDGVVVISVPSGATGAAGYPQAVNIISFREDGDTPFYIDDLYICDQAGSSFNDYLGDVVVHAILPNADAGTNTMAQVGGGVGHFTAINEVTPDFDSSYLYSNTSEQKEMFTLSAFPADIIDVLAVSVNVLAKKSAAGLGLYKSVCKAGGVEVSSGDRSAPINYVQTQYILQSAPDGGAWTLDKAQNATIGVKLS